MCSGRKWVVVLACHLAHAHCLQFTTKYPGKVLSILPADIYAKTKVSKNHMGAARGQVTAKSYDQAASECKIAVEKIAKECRRVNHKYRDSHFDIEFDLKRGPRDCLDSLEANSESETLQPKSVKRVTVSSMDVRKQQSIMFFLGHLQQAAIL